MKKILLLLLLLTGIRYTAAGQFPVRCCNDSTCREKAASYALRLSALTRILGQCQQADSINEQLLATFRLRDVNLYNAFITTSKQVNTFIRDSLNGTCFSDALPDDEANNVFQWLIYINNDAIGNPVFPSAEFCSGWGWRLELSQGGAALLTSQVAYTGSAHGYLTYTFAPANSCGGRFRLLAGPALFLRANTWYTTLSTRAAIRIKDIVPKKLPVGLGNVQAYAEYNTSFAHFNQVALGAEVQLGPFGINAAINNELTSARIGFMVGIFFHQSFKK